MNHVQRQPAIYISHGGGPCFWMEFPPPFGPETFAPLKAYLSDLLNHLPTRPKAILVISAHWEESVVTVNSAANPPMLFDYYGFPEHTYHLNYPAPGAPELALQVQALLVHAVIANDNNVTRGFDHGVFVPMLIIDPQAQIPVVTLSLKNNLNPAEHMAIGATIASLRDEGVLIIGSGNSYHNLRKLADGNPVAATAFDDWLNKTVTDSNIEARNKGLNQWADAPFARECHPREEHLFPLMVVAGAAQQDVWFNTFKSAQADKVTSCFAFGSWGASFS